MITEETTITKKPMADGQSHLGSLSIRAIICIMLVGTVCLMAVLPLVFLFFYNFGNALTLDDVKDVAKIVEPLYSMVLLALGFYFGQRDKPKTQQ